MFVTYMDAFYINYLRLYERMQYKFNAFYKEIFYLWNNTATRLNNAISFDSIIADIFRVNVHLILNISLTSKNFSEKFE